MNGKIEDGVGNSGSLRYIFKKQAEFQKQLIPDIELPKDDIIWSSYHMQALMEEVGEVLKADKRWKTHRNSHYDPQNKLEEIADVIITTINIALFSGFSGKDVYTAIIKKINKNLECLRK